MASMAPSLRCSSPKVTTCSTASKTFSHEVRKAQAVSFHESRRAPAGEEQHVGPGQSALSVAPRNLLDHHPLTAAAIDTSHGVQQKNQKAPERNELESALGEFVISGAGLVALRTNRLRALPGTHRDLDTLVIGTETCLLINESRKTVTTIQNRDEREHEVEAGEGEDYQSKPRRHPATP